VVFGVTPAEHHFHSFDSKASREFYFTTRQQPQANSNESKAHAIFTLYNYSSGLYPYHFVAAGSLLA